MKKVIVGAMLVAAMAGRVQVVRAQSTVAILDSLMRFMGFDWDPWQ